MSKELKPKTVKAKVILLRAMRYKEHMVYIRFIKPDIFMYDVVFRGELYSANLIMKPGKGKTKLSEAEIQNAGALIWAGAVATIESLLGNTLDKQQAELAQSVIDMSERNRRPN